MTRQALLFTVIGFVIGSSVTAVVKNSEHNSQYKIATEAVKVTTDAAQQYIEGYQKLNEHNNELFVLAKSYDDAKDPSEKAKIAGSLVYRIREFKLR